MDDKQRQLVAMAARYLGRCTEHEMDLLHYRGCIQGLQMAALIMCGGIKEIDDIMGAASALSALDIAREGGI